MNNQLKKILQALFLCAPLLYAAQTPVATTKVAPKKIVPAAKTIYNDFTVVLHEETMNKIFVALGEITGTNDYSVLMVKGKYHWTVVNPRINIKPDSSDFTCDAKVDVGPISYKTQVKGNVKIWYDNKANMINVKITTAIFELYTKVLGAKIHIKDIELADYFKDPFQFEGPKTMGTDFEFMTPDSVLKKIYIQPNDCAMEIQWKQISTQCEVAVSEKPFAPIPNSIPVKNEVKTVPLDTARKKTKTDK